MHQFHVDREYLNASTLSDTRCILNIAQNADQDGKSERDGQNEDENGFDMFLHDNLLLHVTSVESATFTKTCSQDVMASFEKREKLCE